MHGARYRACESQDRTDRGEKRADDVRHPNVHQGQIGEPIIDKQYMYTSLPKGDAQHVARGWSRDRDILYKPDLSKELILEGSIKLSSEGVIRPDTDEPLPPFIEKQKPQP